MDYEKLTVVKLKEELKNRGIPLTNLKVKQQYIDRLVEDDSENTSAQPQTDDAALGEQLDQTGTSEDVVPKESAQAEEQEPTSTSPEQPIRAQTDEQQFAQETTVPEPAQASPLPTQEAPAEATEPDAEAPPQATDPEPIQSQTDDTTLPDAPAEPTNGESVPAEDKKRKRRSVTPPVSGEVVSKKLKQAENPVVHVENEDHGDLAMPDAPLNQPQATVQPMATSDDVVDVSTKDHDKKTTRSPNERRFKELINTAEPDAALHEPESDDITVSPALHPATTAVYIQHLVRPINPAGLRDHVEELARPPDHSGQSDASLIKDFWVDALRTHAFFLFTSVSAASRARAGIHARVWPPEPTRRPLWADFFPEDRFSEWVEKERASGGSRPSQAKRWEVVYDVLDDRVDVNLVEAGPSSHRPSIPAGTPNAPLGPRGSMSSGRRPSFQHPEPRRPSQPPPPRPTARAVEEASAPFLELDKIFRFTTTKPKLYWQPVSEDLADDRLDELDRETSRDWDPRRDARENGDSLGRGLDQLKRYTFEDGDVIVDGGPEFGGGRAFARGGGGGRGPRGGRRGADTYRRD